MSGDVGTERIAPRPLVESAHLLWEAAPKREMARKFCRSSDLAIYFKQLSGPLENCCLDSMNFLFGVSIWAYFRKRLSCYSFRGDVRFARCKSIGLQ